MKKILPFLMFCLLYSPSQAQSYYFPPTTGDEWESISPTSLDWSQDSINNLLSFLEAKNSKAFIILKEGRIVVEEYFGDFTKDSPWYWASAGKSLAAFLVGQAQDEGLLHIDSATSKHLGEGWTNYPPEKEALITIKHQMTMTTGINDNVDDLNCLEPACLTYLTDPSTRWSYHNAPYRLIQDVVAKASNMSFQNFTTTRLRNKIGLRGLWINYVFWSRPREMARFGLLALNNGVWNGDTLIGDQNYVINMRSPSQELNPSYGYLWWLNGQGSYMLPRVRLQFQTNLVPTAPLDMYAALGKNDQKIYVVPSLDLVVIRMGEDAGNNNFALSSFDTQLWERLTNIFNTPTNISTIGQDRGITIFPNPAINQLHIRLAETPNIIPEFISIIDALGREVLTTPFSERIQLSSLPSGVYILNTISSTGIYSQHRIIIE